MLEAINNHSKIYNIDDIYNGFSDALLLYENKLLDINKRFHDKVESNLTVQYSSFCKEVLGKDLFCHKNNYSHIDLKKELDLSELMHNFLKHRFQIALDQSVESSSEYPVGNEIHYNKLLVESKNEIVENYEHEYNTKLEKEREIIHKQYRSDLDKLTNQVKENETIIKNKNEEIKASTSKIILLEKENERIEQEYMSKLDNLMNQVKENTKIIEKQK